MPSEREPASAIWALGLAQIIGYGTLHYSFAILAPAMASDLAMDERAVFGAFSCVLLVIGVVAPFAGRLADRVGAAPLMTGGAVALAVAFTACAYSAGPITFVGSLVAIALAWSFASTGVAFAAIVQIRPSHAQKSITLLLLIASFSSTTFWLLTPALHDLLTWRQVYLLFGAAYLLICVPAYAWLVRLSPPSRRIANEQPDVASGADAAPVAPPRRGTFPVMLVGIGLAFFAISGVASYLVPRVVTEWGETVGVLVAALVGPSLVVGRLVTLLFGQRLRQTQLAVVAAAVLAASLAVLATSAPWIPAVIAFAVLFGIGNGLTTVVAGTLPLELFGRLSYGARAGWVFAILQFAIALAPFTLAFVMAHTSLATVLWSLALVGVMGVAPFTWIAAGKRSQPSMTPRPSPAPAVVAPRPGG